LATSLAVVMAEARAVVEACITLDTPFEREVLMALEVLEESMASKGAWDELLVVFDFGGAFQRLSSRYPRRMRAAVHVDSLSS